MKYAIVTLIAVSLVLGAAAQTREVRVMSAGATAPAYLQLIPRFESTAKLKAVTLATSTGLGAQAIVARVRAGEPVDVVLIASNVMDDLVKDGLIRKDSRIDIARSSIGMAVRAGARRPDITTIDGLKQAILNARSIAVSSQISGIYLTNELFPKLGVAEQAAPKTIKVEKGVAGDLVASGEAEIAFQQISELRAVKGIDYVGPLPASVQRVSVFSAGIAAKAPNPSGAKALIDLVLSAAGQDVMKRSGLDPIPRIAAPPEPDLATVRKVTERFQDVKVALAEGYIRDPFDLCDTAEMMGRPPALGAMGVHYFRPDVLGITGPPNPKVSGTGIHTDFLTPSILIYEPQANGSLTLVAVENLAFADAWKGAGHVNPPTFHGVAYNYMADDPATKADDAHQFAPHWDRHVWIYRENPNGVFAPFNPKVSCAHHKGATMKMGPG